MTRRSFLASLLLTCVAPSVRAALGQPAATRIAAVDRAATASLLALGVRPVAVAAPGVYRAMKGFPPLPEGCIDAGYSVEPNLEVIRAVGTQLIVMEATSLHNRGALERVAPVFVLDIFGETGHADFVDQAKAEMFRLARLIGREDAAMRYWQTVQTCFAATRLRLDGYARRPIFVVQLGLGDGTILLYGRNSVTFDVMNRLGFENVWPGTTSAFGVAQVDLEQLADIPHADIFYIDFGADSQAALGALARSPIWTNLPMVRERRVYPMPPFDPLGSLPTAIQFAGSFEAALRLRGPR